jgi:hypothetical protein
MTVVYEYNAKKKSTPPWQAPEKARPSDRLQELASQPRRVLEQSDDGGGGGECAICLCSMAPAETASLPSGPRKCKARPGCEHRRGDVAEAQYQKTRRVIIKPAGAFD